MYKLNSVIILFPIRRLEQALTKANETMGFTATARDLLSDDEEKQFEAAEKYTRLTDCVTDRILESSEPSESLREVMIINMFAYACLSARHSQFMCRCMGKRVDNNIEALIIANCSEIILLFLFMCDLLHTVSGVLAGHSKTKPEEVDWDSSHRIK